MDSSFEGMSKHEFFSFINQRSCPSSFRDMHDQPISYADVIDHMFKLQELTQDLYDIKADIVKYKKTVYIVIFGNCGYYTIGGFVKVFYSSDGFIGETSRMATGFMGDINVKDLGK